MRFRQIAIYARVSSSQQAEAGTIESQLTALRERIRDDGHTLDSNYEFLDRGFSGGVLVRPALEQLRDLIYTGAVDLLYVHSPDRLARKYAYQVVLIEEFQRAGVDVVFLNHDPERTAEHDLLLQVQGIVAEYERAKVLERTRRGKRYAASQGAVSVLTSAPFGYRYVTKRDGGGSARYEIDANEAPVVQQVFAWVGRERYTIGQVCRRLNAEQVPTRTGKSKWNRSTISHLLRNEAYTGAAPFGRNRSEPSAERLRPLRGRTAQSRRAPAVRATPRDEWILIPVPAIIEVELFQLVGQQLVENQKRARGRMRGGRFLLAGLVVCKLCGYAYHGRALPPTHGNIHVWYRCGCCNATRLTEKRICTNKSVRTDLLDEAVWNEVQQLLKNPWRLEQEYRRRLEQSEVSNTQTTIALIETRHEKVRRGIERLIDGYTDGFIEKNEFEPRIKRLKQRVVELEDELKRLADVKSVERDLRLIIGRLDEFGQKIRSGLGEADWKTQREIISALVQRIEVGEEDVTVVFKVGQSPFVLSPARGTLQHCPRHFDPRVSTKPGSKRLGFTIGQQIDGAASLQVNKDGAVSLPTTLGPVVYSEDARRRVFDRWRLSDALQERIWTDPIA